MYGHVGKLAEEIKKGASSVEGVEAKIWQVSPDDEWVFPHSSGLSALRPVRKVFGML